jgi:hypothetical protein
MRARVTIYCIFLFLAGEAIFSGYVLWPRITDFSRQEEQYLKQQIKLLTRYKDILKEVLVRLRSRLKNLEEKRVAPEEKLKLQKMLGDTARGSELVSVTVRSLPGLKVGTKTERFRFEIQAKGSFKGAVKFIRDLEKEKVFLECSDLNLQALPEAEHHTLLITVVVSCYVQPHQG